MGVMSESGFNMGSEIGSEAVREIPLPISSGRYQYFKTFRHGLLNFVKRPSQDYAADMLSVEALRKEFLLCFPLSHPSLVRYVAFENSSLYEEFVDGMTLSEMIDRDDERLRNPDFLLTITRQLFNVLDYIHRQGILHLDIKPENIMITRIGNTLKLIDFSCASSGMSDRTAGFTPGYKAPEQGGRANSCATDLYLAGKVVELLAQKGHATRKWKSFISKAIAPDPSLRFQSAQEALTALPDKADRKIPVYFYIAGIMVLLSVAMVILWSVYKSSPSPKTIEPAITQNVTDTLHKASNDIITTQPQEQVALSPPHEELSTRDVSSQKESQAAPMTPTSVASVPAPAPTPAPVSVPAPAPVSAPEATYPDHVYLIGNVEGNWMDPLKGIPMTGKNGIYTGVFEFTRSTRDSYSYFLLSEQLGETWDNTGTVWSNNSKKSQNKEATLDEEGFTAQYDTREDTSNPFKLLPGKYEIRFDLNNSRVTITRRSN